MQRWFGAVGARSAFAALVCAVVLVVAACGSSSSPTSPSGTDVASLTVTDLTVGTGTEATAGRTVTVNYTGWLYSAGAPDNKGQQFDSSLTPGRTPFPFRLGVGSVIRGWDQGVVGMKVGGTRRLVIPSSLAYGSSGSSGVIPPNAALVFDIELLSVQ